jgi:hypothetical protein
MSKAKVQGTYLVLPDGGNIRIKMKKVKSENINPPPAIRQGRLIDDEFEPVYNGTLPLFRADALMKILAKTGIDVTSKEVLRHLGVIPFCAMCGKGEPLDHTLDDGTPICSDCFKTADHVGEDPLPTGLEEIPEDRRFKLPELEVPEVLTNIFKGDALKQFYGMLTITMMQLQDIPLTKTSRVKVDRSGTIVPKDDWKKYLVTEDNEGIETLSEFPYLLKTHFIHINEGGKDNSVHPRIYWDQFKTLDKGSYYQVTAYDDSGRFALWKLARKYMSGEYEFSDGTKGEAMIVMDAYHATSGTTQEYIALLAPVTYVDEDGENKFIWVMKTTQARIKWTEGMEIPKEGETPDTVPAQRTVVLNKSFNEMLAGLVKA